MKTLKLILAACAAAFVLNSCTPGPDEARAYNDTIIGLENPLAEKETAFIDMLSADKASEEMKKAYDDLVKQSDEAMAGIEKVEAFDNSAAFRDAAKEYFATFRQIVHNEYKSILELASKNPDDITDDDSKKYEDLLVSVQDKSEKALAKIQNEQTAFATKYKFEIEKEKDVEQARP
jgi:hypothetical protein